MRQNGEGDKWESGGEGGHKGQTEGAGCHPEQTWRRGRDKEGRSWERGRAGLLCSTGPMIPLVLSARKASTQTGHNVHGLRGHGGFCHCHLGDLFHTEATALYWPKSYFWYFGCDLEMLVQAVLEFMDSELTSNSSHRLKYWDYKRISYTHFSKWQAYGSSQSP